MPKTNASIRGIAPRRVALLALLPVLLTACLEHRNPYDPQTPLALVLEGPDTVEVDLAALAAGRLDSASFAVRWEADSDHAPDWEFVPGGVIEGERKFSTGLVGGQPLESRARVRFVQTGNLSVSVGFEGRRADKRVVIVAQPYWGSVDRCDGREGLVLRSGEAVLLRLVIRSRAGEVLYDTECEESSQRVTWLRSDANVLAVFRGRVQALEPGTGLITVRQWDFPFTFAREFTVLP